MRSTALTLAFLAGFAGLPASAQYAVHTLPSSASQTGGYLGGVCGTIDDGSTENGLGLTAGGEMGWMHLVRCKLSATSVSTAYGTAMFPGTITNGNASRIAVYEDVDLDEDATTGLTLLASLSTVVTSGNTDVLNPNAIGAGFNSCSAWIMATCDHSSSEFPAPMDQNNSSNESWVVGNTGGNGSLDLADLNNNTYPPESMDALGFPTVFLLRLDGGDCVPGAPSCFGDGTGGNSCPCGNDDPSGSAGCKNSSTAGCSLAATGSPSLAADNVVLVATNADPEQPGLFFQGDNNLSGTGLFLGDGIRCCGGSVLRLEVVDSDPSGTATLTVSIPDENTDSPDHPDLMPGDTKCYQYWYRDPDNSPCFNGFNTSNAYDITWAP